MPSRICDRPSGVALIVLAGTMVLCGQGQQAQQSRGVTPPTTISGVGASYGESAVGLNVPSASLQPDQVAPEVPDTYQIGPNDLLSIFVYQMPELTTQVRVSTAGNVQIPMLAQPVPAAGRTGPQLAAAIASDLTAEGLARRPRVQVLVRQVDSRTVVIAGAVRTPVVLQAWRPMTVLEAISRAGGFTEQVGSTVLVTQSGQNGATTQAIAVDDLLSGSGPDPLLTGRDTVRVVPARLVYSVGAVKQPGAFPLRPGEPLSVLKMLALSQGLGSSPDLHHSEIIRPGAQGPAEIVIDLKKILEHKAPDVAMLAGDILYVPEDGKRKLLTNVVADVGQIAVISLGYGASSKIR